MFNALAYVFTSSLIIPTSHTRSTRGNLHEHASEPSLQSSGAQVLGGSLSRMDEFITLTRSELQGIIRYEVGKALAASARVAAGDVTSQVSDHGTSHNHGHSDGTSQVSDHGGTSQVTDHGTSQSSSEDVEPDFEEYVRLNLLEVKNLARAHHKKEPEEFTPKFTKDVMKFKIPSNVKDLEHWGEAIVQDGKFKGRFLDQTFLVHSYMRMISTSISNNSRSEFWFLAYVDLGFTLWVLVAYVGLGAGSTRRCSMRNHHIASG